MFIIVRKKTKDDVAKICFTEWNTQGRKKHKNTVLYLSIWTYSLYQQLVITNSIVLTTSTIDTSEKDITETSKYELVYNINPQTRGDGVIDNINYRGELKILGYPDFRKCCPDFSRYLPILIILGPFHCYEIR